ncbi:MULTISPECIES: hypothetical protein [unclassified Bradyrhizobium]|uniref:hypothetical protein n=1 Tax=unclassified Bradyrhizobium TaxID=2631580 RepID=UPI002916677E|nr:MULTISPECIES: hypothetical protein [unclassified Bradyrhizobium]
MAEEETPTYAIHIKTGRPAADSTDKSTERWQELVERRTLRSREELMPVALQLVQDQAVVHQFRAVHGSDNEELASQFIDEIARSARAIDPDITQADAARITVILMEMLTNSGEDSGGTR